MNKIAIIGGGASGLMAALFAARTGADVTIYEHNNGVGKKILASGNGRCNIINTTVSIEDYAGVDPSFVTYALKQLPFESFEAFCHSIGLLLERKSDGRCYPFSNEAKAVLIAFKHAVSDTGVKILTEKNVTAITKEKKNFAVHCENEKSVYDKVLIATGSQAAPQLGATDDGYRFASKFGHEIITQYPSLVQLHLNSKIHHKMAGVKTFAEVTLFVDGRSRAIVSGDILFASYGISGLAILDISQMASHALMKKQRVVIGINLLPQFEDKTLEDTLKKLFISVPDHPIETVLSTLLPTKTIVHICEEVAINPTKFVSALTEKEIQKLIHLIQNWKFEAVDTHGFKHAEVSGGGVATAQIDNETMESKLVEGLYFAGEVLDIVGRRGGYNFNFAWASGMIAGKEMAKTTK
jgi:predicted Rossmann fold flavoprotein